MLHLAGTLQITHGLRDLALKHGPLMHLQLGEISAVVVSSARVAKEVLKTHDIAFADRPKLVSTKILLRNEKDLVMSIYGDYWRQMRKLCTVELLNTNKVSFFRSIREEEVWRLVQSIQSSLESPINLSKRFSAFTNAVTCIATIGKRSQLQDELVQVIEDIASLAGGFDVSDLFPSIKLLHVLSGMRPKLQTIRKKLDNIFDNIILEHKENRNRTNKGYGLTGEEDLVDVLLSVQERGGFEFPVTTDDIYGLILNMLIGGTDTSATALEWTMSELIRNPRVLEKVQAEVRQALKGKTTIHENDIQGLSYLKLVIKETLRLHPPLALLLPRLCRDERQIDGYQIPIDTKLIINAWAIGRDPGYWVDAESFEPERFDNISADFNGVNLNYIPFGSGRRMCPGISFGVATVELPLALLLYHFNWKLPFGMKPESLDMSETFGATLKRKNNLCLIATSCIPSNN
uniref:Cytochrome P450 CYP71D312 n=2 Tax=cellular organisms TaxID=131567 RepID=C7D31_PANGI|nr:RecName: Full=Cytochrome P450 CYP71D312 [Panax ginseng]AEY75216.1 cytochrome P450 CYP71D312 [Panax ginseng]